MEKNPKISLIICTRNRADTIPETLDCALRQDLAKDLYEIVVMDQSTDDETQKLAETCPDLRYIRLTSRGLTVSRNEGISYSRGSIIVYADDDLLFEHDYLSSILEFFNSEMKPDMVGGKIIPKYMAEKPEWIDGPLLGALAYSDYGDEAFVYSLSHPKHIPYGGNMAIRRECLEKMGGFASLSQIVGSNITVENEDVLFANKLHQFGYRAGYCPKMKVFHKIQAGYLTYEYYKNRYHSQGKADAFAYYLLGKYSRKNVPSKILIHTQRLIDSLFLRHFKKNISDKYYQKLRLYYNSGYIRSLLKILFSKGCINENSRISSQTAL